MPFLRPTLTALRAQAMQDITASPLPGADGLLSKSVLRVMAWVQAGFAYLHYGYLDWIAQRATPWGATDEYALAWGALKGILPKTATAAGGGTATTTAVAGAIVSAGSPLIRGDGISFVTTADATAGLDGSLTLPVAATSAGSTGNTATGSLLVLSSGALGTNSNCIVALPIVGGSDDETPDAFKTRYLAAYAAPPQGGDRADYIEWTLAVPGITRAWMTPSGFGAGTVVIYPMLDDSNASNGGFPLGTAGTATNETRDANHATGDLLTVANALLPLQPATALIYAVPPVPTPVPFTITTLAPNTAAIQQAIDAALTDMFLRLGNVGGSIDPLTGAPWPPIYPSDWDAAISSVPGIAHFTVASPATPITPAAGQLFTAGPQTFTS